MPVYKTKKSISRVLSRENEARRPFFFCCPRPIYIGSAPRYIGHRPPRKQKVLNIAQHNRFTIVQTTRYDIGQSKVLPKTIGAIWDGIFIADVLPLQKILKYARIAKREVKPNRHFFFFFWGGVELVRYIGFDTRYIGDRVRRKSMF